MLPDSAGLNLSTSVGPQPTAVANPAVALPQTTMATRTVANVGTTASHTRPIQTAVLSTIAYIPPARLPYVDPRPIHGPNLQNLNSNRSQSDGIHRNSLTVVSTATIRNSLPSLNPHATTNTRAGDNHNQVASAKRNIMKLYSTTFELQQVVELSAVDEEIRRLQVKWTAIVACTVDPSTSTPNPNLSAPQSATLNAFAQPFGSTQLFPVPQPWTMSGYATPFQTSLLGVPGGQLIAGAGTQVGLQLQPQCRNLQLNHYRGK